MANADLSWAFNCSDCANRRTALYRESGNYQRAQREASTALLLRELSLDSYRYLHARPWEPADNCSDDEYKTYETALYDWEVKRNDYLERHLGCSPAKDSERFTSWCWGWAPGPFQLESPDPLDAQYD